MDNHLIEIVRLKDHFELGFWNDEGTFHVLVEVWKDTGQSSAHILVPVLATYDPTTAEELAEACTMAAGILSELLNE